MYRIKFYADKKGNSPVREYIKSLAKHGTTIGEPYMKKIGGEIWELRPLSDRILFAALTGNSFVLLSHFVKKTRKTPSAEIEKAGRLLKEFKERSDGND